MASAFNINPGATLADLEAAHFSRLYDARALYGAGRFASCIVLAIYSLEILLKAKICQRLELAALPKGFEFHNLDILFRLAGLRKRVDALGSDPVRSSWDTLLSISDLEVNEQRYRPDSPTNQPKALEILECLQDSERGVLRWLFEQN